MSEPTKNAAATAAEKNMNIMAHDLRAQVFFSQSLLRPPNNAEGSSKNFKFSHKRSLWQRSTNWQLGLQR